MKARAKPVQEFWHPMKVLPWSALSYGDKKCEGPEGCFGFIPVYDTREQVEREFPGDATNMLRTAPSEVEKCKPKARNSRKEKR